MKRTTITKPKIRPLSRWCQACRGKRVTDHHWLCNDCWDKIAMANLRKREKKLNVNDKKVSKKMTKIERKEWLKKQGRLINA